MVFSFSSPLPTARPFICHRHDGTQQTLVHPTKPYSPLCREEFFLESGFLPNDILGYSTSATTHTRKPYIWIVLRVGVWGYAGRVAAINNSRKSSLVLCSTVRTARSMATQDFLRRGRAVESTLKRREKGRM